MTDMEGKAIVLQGDQIAAARVLALRQCLKLEMVGLTRRGRSAYSIIKTEFGFKGSREKVLAQLNEFIEAHILPPA